MLTTLAIGGSERKIVRLANRLRDRGMKVGCAYLQKPDLLASELSPDIPVFFLDRRGRFS